MRRESDTQYYQNEITVLLNCIYEAGIAVRNIQQHGFTTIKKTNNDPLTEADLVANDILKNALLSAFPKDAWLSEETLDDKARLSNKRVWIIDPIDGTIEFTKRLPEFAISVALVVDHQPVIAAIYNPCTDELFHAIKRQGCWLNNDPIHCKATVGEQLTMLASRTEFEKGQWDIFSKHHHVQPIGSIAYKLALIAAGKADASFSLGPKSEWDIAAGCLLITEAGGIVLDKYQKQFVFNQPNVRVNSIVATSNLAHAHVFALIQSNPDTSFVLT